MSLSIDGVWKAGVWATTVWATGVWREGIVIVYGHCKIGAGARSRPVKTARPGNLETTVRQTSASTVRPQNT